MHFGEYELSPSLIGLSLLPSPHPEAFQRLSVRASIGCYPDFTLDKGRSLGFASACTNYIRPVKTRSRFGCVHDMYLTSLVPATRRFIMQKARRHSLLLLRPLVGARVQGLFHSHTLGAFHLSLTVLVHYRSLTSI